MRSWLGPLCALTLGACSAIGSPDSLIWDSGASLVPGTLTVNVYPSTDGGLLPQSFVVLPASETGYGTVDLTLADSVTVSGMLSSLVAHTWSAVGAPTDPEPFTGSVQVVKDGTVQGAAVRSDAAGWFSMRVPAGGGYALFMTPDDPTIAGGLARDGQGYMADTDLTQELPNGVPLFGRVTSAGVGLRSAPLVLTRTEPGPAASTALFHTDADGWYAVRVPGAGAYTLTVQPGLSDAGVVLPQVERSVTLGDSGGALDVEVGALASAVLAGTVVDATGGAVADARVRLTAQALDGVDGALVVESSTDVNGSFVARLIPGTFTAEVLPAYDSPVSPKAVTVHAQMGTNDLGILALDGFTAVSGVISLPDGSPAAGVAVSATEVGWSNYVYSAVTDARGAYTLSLPAADVQLLCTPPSTSGAAVTRVDLPVGGDPSVMLVPGQLLQGMVQGSAGVTPYAVVEVRSAATGQVLGSAISGEDGTWSLMVDVPMQEATDTGGGDTGVRDTGPKDTADTGGRDTGGKDTADTGASDTGTQDSGGA